MAAMFYTPAAVTLSPPQVMALLTTPLAAVLGQSSRQVGGFITIAVMGAVGIHLK
jgi:hypothetical protein